MAAPKGPSMGQPLKFKPNVQTTGQRAVCHIKVAEVAKAAANELYDSMMSSNGFYNVWRNQNKGCNSAQLRQRFVDRNWPNCIEFARTTLTVMLTKDDISESMKDDIMIILEQDQMLRDKTVASPQFGKLN